MPGPLHQSCKEPYPTPNGLSFVLVSRPRDWISRGRHHGSSVATRTHIRHVWTPFFSTLAVEYGTSQTDSPRVSGDTAGQEDIMIVRGKPGVCLLRRHTRSFMCPSPETFAGDKHTTGSKHTQTPHPAIPSHHSPGAAKCQHSSLLQDGSSESTGAAPLRGR